MLSHQVWHRIAPVLFSAAPGLPRSIPGPEPSPWLGTAGAMLPWAADTLGHAGRLFRQYGRVVALVRGGGTRHINPNPSCPGTVLAYGPEHVRDATALHDLFTKTNLSGALYPGHEPPPRQRPLLSFGAGLFSVNGDEHKRHRRLLMPAFSKRRLEGYCEEMVRQTRRELETWNVGQERDVSLDLRRLAANIVARTLFGEAGGAASLQASQHLQDALHLMGRPITRVAPFDLPGLPFRRYLDVTGRLEEQMLAVLAARKRVSAPSNDMLHALIQARDEESGTRLTDAEILGHVSVFFAAGHETSANSLAWTVLLLALFPEVTGRASEEVDGVLRGGDPTPDTLDRLEYLGWVVKESLRLFTPAPWNGRIVAEPTRLGDHELPRGTEVLVSIYETHRIREVFPDPLAFAPERWETAKPSVYEYNPFSTGPRTCIGAGFATMEIKLVLAMLLQRFRLALMPQRVDRFAELVLSPKHGLKVRVERKDGNFRASRAPITGNVFDMIKLPIQ